MQGNVYFIDLFCGAGGTSSGIHKANLNGRKVKVIACINHDTNAILSHMANHPSTLHYVEDIRTIDLHPIVEQVSMLRTMEPDCTICIWASLECTNYSKAKGGLARNEDSRTLATHLLRYISCINPEHLFIENVEEFMSWGALDEFGQPIKNDNGVEYNKWVKSIKNFGYQYEYKLMNSADYGVPQSRKRLFINFAKQGIKIKWPVATHSKTGKDLPKWRAVKHLLDFNDIGNSIFGRKKPLVENTLRRIYLGLVKFVGREFLIKYNSINKHTGHYVPPSVDEPCPTVTTQNRIGLVQPVLPFLVGYHGKSESMSVDRPSPTIMTKDKIGLTQAFFIKYYGSGNNIASLDGACPTLTTKDRMGLIQPGFIYRDFSNSGFAMSLDAPAGTVMTNPKLSLVTCQPWLMDTQFSNIGHSLDEPAATVTANRKHHYLVNPQYDNKGSSVDKPCFTLIARMDKAAPYLITAENGYIPVEIAEEDSPYTKLIKQFMLDHGLYDVKMRMLRIPELLKIQGFPEDYILIGTEGDKKKYIGNAVPVKMAKLLIESNFKIDELKVSKIHTKEIGQSRESSNPLL